MDNVSTCALRTFARFIDEMNFDRVTAFDPHSDVCGQLIDRFSPIWPIAEIDSAWRAVDADVLCYPDEGAVKKYTKCIRSPFIRGRKDQRPGER